MLEKINVNKINLFSKNLIYMIEINFRTISLWKILKKLFKVINNREFKKHKYFYFSKFLIEFVIKKVLL